MRDGTLRGFITVKGWSEVPRVLEDRWREGGGAFDLAAAERAWWHDYVPLLYTVDTDYLPSTPEADRLAEEDPSDVAMVLLHAVLGPAALLASDGDLRRTGLAHHCWADVRAALGQIGYAERTAQAVAQIGGLTVEGSARLAVKITRTAWNHPVLASLVALGLASGLASLTRSRPSLRPKVQSTIARIGEATAQLAGEVRSRYARGETTWSAAERGPIGAALLPRLARLLACADKPMTRTAILNAVPDVPGSTKAERLYNLYVFLRMFPMFCEVQPHRWQVGRVDVGAMFI